MGSGSSSARVSSGGTWRNPSGFPSEQAIFATSLLFAIPHDTVSCVTSRTRAFRRSASACGLGNKRMLAVMSRNASSSAIGSMIGVNSSNTLCTSSDTREYFSMSDGRKTPCGQSSFALKPGIALRTPNTRAA